MPAQSNNNKHFDINHRERLQIFVIFDDKLINQFISNSIQQLIICIQIPKHHKMYYFYIPTFIYQGVYQQITFLPQKTISFPQIISQSNIQAQNNAFKIVEQVKENNIEPMQYDSLQKDQNNENLIKKRMKKNKDQQYSPEDEYEVKQRKYNQLQNRNIIPNLIRSTLTFINQKRKSLSLVQKLLLLQKVNSQQNYNTAKFYHYQKILKNKIGNYVNEKTLQIFERYHPEIFQIFSLQQQSLYNKISRILIQSFINEEIKINILTSNRINTSMKKLNLQAARNLSLKLKALIRGQSSRQIYQ